MINPRIGIKYKISSHAHVDPISLLSINITTPARIKLMIKVKVTISVVTLLTSIHIYPFQLRAIE
jgi:hypothetical protein